MHTGRKSARARAAWLVLDELELVEGQEPYMRHCDTKSLREWGYVFWDAQRLESLGTIAGGKYDWDSGKHRICEHAGWQSLSPQSEKEPGVLTDREVHS
jgi:hypothetical protein